MNNTIKSGSSENNISAFPSTLAGYNNDIIKVFEKYTGTNLNYSGIRSDIPGTIPVYAYDIGNYIAKYHFANFQIQAVMKLDGRLNFQTLSKAVRISVDAEPVLGCRFIKSDPPYWKRFEDIDNINFCSMEVTDNSDACVESFLSSSMRMDKDPMLKVKLIRSGSSDTLCIKINHVCSDAAGARQYIHLLSDIYSSIDSTDSDYVPTPSVRDRKDHENLKAAFGEDTPDKTWGVAKQAAKPTWRFPWKNGRTGDTGFAVCRLPYGQLDIMKSYAKARNATINDLILTAVFRAFFEISKPPYGVPMDIPITIDLRRYLPWNETEAIRNLSGGIVIRVARKASEDFEGTLTRVMALTKDIKTKHPSIQNLYWAEFIEKLSFQFIRDFFRTSSKFIDFASLSPFYIVDKCSPVLSNFGFISKFPLRFGENTVTDAYIIPPVVRAPGMLLVASTYNGIISLAVGYYKPSVRKTDMEGLINKIKDELIKGCTSEPEL